jgi:hypothetical protein
VLQRWLGLWVLLLADAPRSVRERLTREARLAAAVGSLVLLVVLAAAIAALVVAVRAFS